MHEIRNIITPDEKLAADTDNREAVGGLKGLVAQVIHAHKMGWLRSRVLKTEQPILIDESREGTVMPELELVVGGQVNRMVRLGYHSVVYPELSPEMAELRYRADFTLPKNADQPEDFAGRFDFAIVREPRIALVRKHELAAKLKELNLDRMVRDWPRSQVKEYINTDEIEDPDDQDTYPKDIPYVFFTHDGYKHLGYSVKDGLKRFDSDELGMIQGEVTDHYMQKPVHFKFRGHDAAASLYDGRVPDLDAFLGGPNVNAYSPGIQGRFWGAASRGNKIIVLGV